ncbi:hypothetical protein [Marinobacterium sp. BA1]|uniref:hypothetical protein n=1 Tax=Marinobacterium sp. BA1 TaxID=3138931 RepID=UPI0034E89891
MKTCDSGYSRKGYYDLQVEVARLRGATPELPPYPLKAKASSATVFAGVALSSH